MSTEGTRTLKRKASTATDAAHLTNTCMGLLRSGHSRRLRLAICQYIQEHPAILLDSIAKGDSIQAIMESCIREINASKRKHTDRVYITAHYYGCYGASDDAQGTMCLEPFYNMVYKARYEIRQQGKHANDTADFNSFSSHTEDNYYIVEGNKSRSFEWKTGAVTRLEDNSDEDSDEDSD